MKAEVDPSVSVRALCWALLRSDGTIRLQEVADIGTSLGLSEQTIRHGVRRLCEREGFVRKGRGRDAVASVGPRGADLWDLDGELIRFAYRQDAGREPWDGRWRLMTFSIPETRRADRDRLRSWLRAMGGAAVSQATYVSPHGWWDAIHPMVEQLDLTSSITWGELDRLVVAGLSQPVDIAAYLWPSDAIDDAYEAALAGIEQAVEAWDGLDDAARRRAWVAVTVNITGPFEKDPLLPPELAAPPGRAAREAYRALTERFLEDVDDADQYSVALEMNRAAGDLGAGRPRA